MTVSFPPDTDTPGFIEENKDKPEETRLISQAAGLFPPENVAKALLNHSLVGIYLILLLLEVYNHSNIVMV